MNTSTTQYTDTERLEAMFRHGWRTYKHKGKTRINGIKAEFATPREALDNAMRLELAARGKTQPKRAVLTSSIPPGFVWNRWEQHVFPAGTSRYDLISSARVQGWRLSIILDKKSNNLSVMATDTLKRGS